MSEVRMPQLGETVMEGTIVQWFKQVGDEVAEDEPLFEVSTDKVDSEVPSPMSGVLVEIVAAEGDIVEVGAVIAVLSEDGAGVGTAPAPAPVEAPRQEPEPAPAPTTAPEPQASAPAAADEASASGGSSIVLSPVVRRLISENGLDPSQISGTGKGGRITRADVEGHIAQNRTTSPLPAPAAPPVAPVPVAQEEPPAAPAADDDPGAVTSPLVGVVYVAPEPGGRPFVVVGDEINEGDTLFIVEAMKTMNPVRAPRGGRVTRILAENGARVEYGEVLLILE